MSDADAGSGTTGGDGERRGRRPDVRDVVAISERGEGFAYRPREVLVRGIRAAERLAAISELDVGDGISSDDGDARPDEGLAWYHGVGIDRPLTKIDQLRAEGFAAQPNHVFFAHSCGPACPPHPALGQALLDSLWADPLRASPLRASPLRASPLRASPLRASPLRASPLRASGPFENTAVPTDEPLPPARVALPGSPPARIHVLDTGVAGIDPITGTDHRPQAPNTGNLSVSGDVDLPDVEITIGGGNPMPRDGYLDPVAGHGIFIAGIIESLAPGCQIIVERVIGPLGDADEKQVADTIKAISDGLKASDPPTIISMSFGGQTLDGPGLLRTRISEARDKGIVFVASAGNDGVCTPQYPAAFPDVEAVGALGPSGPVEWTNYGDWVDACAPATDLVSWFFDDFDGDFPTINSHDPDHFSGRAVWSGTSFAVPVVVARIATELATGVTVDGNGNQLPIDLDEAVHRVIRAPHQTRIPCLGTVVSI